MPTWHVYLIRTRHGTLYTGIATDVERRLAEHRGDGRKGSKYLRSRGPLHLVYQVSIGTRATALQVEARIKRLAKQEKETIVAADPTAPELLTTLGLGDG